MAQSINDVYLFVQDLINKNQNGYLPPAEFNRLINQAQYSRFNELYGKPEQFAAVNMPVAKIAYARTQEISEKLSPFIITSPLTFASGSVAVPSDLVHAVSITAGGKAVKRVEFDRLANYINSTIDNPTAEYPIYSQRDTTYNIYPSTIASGSLTYLRLPTAAVWGFTVVGDEPVYDAGASVNLEWDTTEITNIAMKLLSMYGISVKDQQVVNYAEQQKVQGN